MEQEGVGGQQGHEGGDGVLAAESVEGVCEGRRKKDGDGSTARGLDCGAGLVGGQLQGMGDVSEVLAPPGEVLVEDGALQPLALPAGEVGVLDGQGRKGRGPVLGEGFVEGGDFAHQYAHGPAVGDDVVEGEQQHVRVFAEAQQDGAKQRAGGQVEGAQGLLACDAPHFFRTAWL